MKGAHFPPTFPHPRFLERKLGKELCAKLRFASGDAALRGGVLMISRLPRLCQTRRCHFNPASPKFLLFRPQRAEARRAQGLVLGRRKVTEISLEGVPRKMGAWGQAAYERPLRVGAHRRRPPTHLWLLSVRAESNTRLSY